MPGRVWWQNNERVDVPDLNAATNGGDDVTDPGFAEAVARQMLERFVMANYPAIAEGFRVEISDQKLTVHNGFAFDRSGAMVEDESAADMQISTVLPNPGTTYYLEVEFQLAEANADARAFWDPTYDQGVDPSGDARPPGKEFSLQVATRFRPTWNIVSPISTTDFAINVNPNSLKIPVARLETNIAGEIDNATPATQTARSTLRESTGIGATEVKLINTRHMQDSFTLRVPTWDGAAFTTEDLTVTANDRENNILTLGVPAAAEHLVGDAAYDVTVGAPQFLAPRATPPLPTADTQDARPRYWQGDEQQGMAALRDPNSNTAQTDTEIANQKQFVDAIAATILDMKLGGALPPQSPSVTNAFGQNVVTTFNGSQSRWTDRVGSIAGGKCATVTIGSGTDSWGDFNVGAYTSFQACVAAALSAVQAGGFTSAKLYLKRSAKKYSVAGTTITLSGWTKGLTICGDGDDTEIEFTGAVPAFTISGASNIVTFEDLKITRSGATANYAVEITAAAVKLSAYRCSIESVGRSGAGTLANGYFERCAFAATSGGAGRAFYGVVTSTKFTACTFSTSVNGASSAAVDLLVGSIYTRFDRCSFSATGNTIVGAVLLSTSSDVSFDGCEWTLASAGAGGLWGIYSSSATNSVVRLRDCQTAAVSGTAYGLLNVTSASKVRLDRCVATYSADAAAVNVAGGGLIVRDCEFTQASSGGAKTGAGVNVADLTAPSLIDTVTVTNPDFGVYATASGAMSNLTIRKLTMTNATATSGKRGVHLVAGGTLTKVLIDDCDISGLDDSSVAVDGILVSGGALSSGITISRNRISSSGSGVANVSGIRTVGALIDGCISENEIVSISATTLGIGVYVNDDGTNSPQAVSISNNKIRTVTTSGGPSYGVAIPSFTRASARGNVITGITGSTNAAGIYTGANLAAVSNCLTLDISNNQIAVLEGTAGFARAVYVVRGAIGTVIANNQVGDLDAAGSGGDGVYVDTQSAVGGGQVVKSLSITGNVMQRVTGADTFTNGIAVLNLRFAGDLECLTTITGNQVQQFTGYGVRVMGEVGQSTQNVTISGNALHSTVATMAAIELNRVSKFSISGNSIVLSLAAQNQHGISCDSSCFDGVIGQNQVFVDTPGANYYGIYTDGYATLVDGNKVRTDNVQCIYVGGSAAPGGDARNQVGVNSTQTGSAIAGSYGVTLLGGANNTDRFTNSNPAAATYLAGVDNYGNFWY